MRAVTKLIYDGYKHWATTHTPTWETDNVIGDLIDWPEWFEGLYKPVEVITEKKYGVKK